MNNIRYRWCVTISFRGMPLLPVWRSGYVHWLCIFAERQGWQP